MARKQTVSKWKKKAWKLFSIYIRRRDAFKNEPSGEYAKCCTCGRVYHWKKLQAGHFIGGRRNSVLFDTRNVHAQCYGCNCMQEVGPQYFIFMEKEYGRKVIDELMRTNNTVRKFKIPELKAMCEDFEKRTAEL